MSTKKKEDRIKSAQSNSPYGRKLKEGTSGGISNDGKPPRINIWPEWSETDVNNEKWEVSNKAKEKEKIKSPPMAQNWFDDPDGRLRLPSSLKAVKWKRSSEYFTKNPVIVDADIGVQKFDIFTPNEHLFVSETMRWIISQINILWISSEKIYSSEIDNQIQEMNVVNSDGKYHSWKFWEHIYSLNKVGKGFPQYNPSGKYIVKLFWMGEWRKLLIDDTLPFDENDQLLLPITSLKNELWPIILSKALLKIASLSYGYYSNDTEFGDFSVIHSLTGWIPQKKIISKEHKTQIWNDLQKLLCHWTLPDSGASSDKNDNLISTENQNLEMNIDKTDMKEAILKDKLKKDVKDTKQKDKKEKDKIKPEKTVEGKSGNENPETLILASYTSSYNKINMLSASKMADHSEALRKIGISQIYSHPLLINYYRDCPLKKPKSPEIVPSWKLIRPLIKPELPKANDCIKHDVFNSSNDRASDIQFLEIQSPFLNYKFSNQRYSNMSLNSVGNIVEDLEDKFDLKTDNDSLNVKSIKDDKEMNKDSEISKNGLTLNRTVTNLKSAKNQINDTTMEDEMATLNPIENKNELNNEMAKYWIDLDSFYDCFEFIHIYHKTETYRYTENFSDMKQSTSDQKEPMYLFTDNLDSTEIIFCFSSFCKWFTINDIPYLPDQIIRNSPSTAIIKDSSNNFETISPETDNDISLSDNLRGIFIAENHSWKTFKIGKCFKRTRTNGIKAISLKLPPGRNCLRIFIQSINGFHCKLISQNPFHFGNEDKILPLSVEEPKRIVTFGLNIVSLFNNIIVNFSNEKERYGTEKSFIDTILGFKEMANLKLSTSKFSEVFNHCLLTTLNKMSKDLITPDMLFALRVLNLDFQNSNMALNTGIKQSINSSRNSAKTITNTKVDNRKQSSTKSMISNEPKEEKKTEFIKEYSSADLIKIVKLQKLFRGCYVRRIIKARNSLSDHHNRVVKEINKISSLIEQNASEMGINLLNVFVEKFPQILKYYGFESDKKNHICLQEYIGNSNLQSGNGFGILFRDIFHINSISKSEFLMKINCNVPKCTLSVVNNDTGETFSEHVLKRLHLPALTQNNSGYTLMATVKDVDAVIDWKLKLISDGNNILPKFSKPELSTDLSISKLKDYYIPDETGLLFQQMIKVKVDHQVSVFVKLSNPNIPIRLSIFNFDEEIYFTEGFGESFIQTFIFFKDQCTDEQIETSGRSPSRNSNKSKKFKDRYSAKNSRTNSSCSTDENKVNKYSIQAFINSKNWPLSESNQEFVDKLKQSRKKDMSEIKLWNDSPSKSVQSTELPKKEINQKNVSKTKGKDKTQESSKSLKPNEKLGIKNANSETNLSRPNSSHFDDDKAYWMAFIISDSSLEDNIQIYKNNEKYDNLRAIKKVWLESDPLRFEKGKQIQMKYNEENQMETNYQGNPDKELPIVEQDKEHSLRNSLPNTLDLSLYYLLKNITQQQHLVNDEQTRYKNIELFRTHQAEFNLWCQTEKLNRNNKIAETLREYNQRQKDVDFHRLAYFKTREKLKQVNQTIKKDSVSK